MSRNEGLGGGRMTVEDLDLGDRSFADVAKDVMAECAALDEAEGSTILATDWAWAIRDEPGVHSISAMDDEELAQSLVEDLLSVFYWQRLGKDVFLTRETVCRHVPNEMKPRVAEALEHPFVRSVLLESEDGQLGIHPHHLQDAMDFSGVWHEGFEALTSEYVYRASSPGGLE